MITATTGDLEITSLGHGALMLHFGGTVSHVGSVSRLTAEAKLPKADLVRITYEHQDHLNRAALEEVLTKDTKVAVSAPAAAKVPEGREG